MHLEKSVTECLVSNYGLKDVKLTLLNKGADLNVMIFKSKSSSGSYFVKLTSNHESEFSLSLLDFLKSSKIDNIIPPIENLSGNLSTFSGEYRLFSFSIY